jgi:hypothetical protein
MKSKRVTVCMIGAMLIEDGDVFRRWYKVRMCEAAFSDVLVPSYYTLPFSFPFSFRNPSSPWSLLR